jgi:hypothetical protein
MMHTLLMLFAIVAGYAGFACLALAMPDHWESAGGDPGKHAQRRDGLRLWGPLMLWSAFAICLWRDGPSFGTLLWVMLMSASGIAVAFTLTWRPKLLLWGSRARWQGMRLVLFFNRNTY